MYLSPDRNTCYNFFLVACKHFSVLFYVSFSTLFHTSFLSISCLWTHLKIFAVLNMLDLLIRTCILSSCFSSPQIMFPLKTLFSPLLNWLLFLRNVFFLSSASISSLPSPQQIAVSMFETCFPLSSKYLYTFSSTDCFPMFETCFLLSTASISIYTFSSTDCFFYCIFKTCFFLSLQHISLFFLNVSLSLRSL